MTQENIWEREYRTRKLVTLGEKPGADLMDFLRFLQREQKIALENLTVLDLGSGTGKNSQHLAELDAIVTGYEISDTALKLARERAVSENLAIAYEKRNIGTTYPLADSSVDLILDVTSSNSLDEAGRTKYLLESSRRLKTA